ncbi:nucleoside deaminase [Clostridium sediminicola]|uniref:tRNA adenosine(34) deaminase TadA n=1 Tax=Clostridium sediminicola TaxID=3114879 RepID=UPI0031F27F10
MDKIFMKKALEEAKEAFFKGEVPVGAVIVRNNEIISYAHNLRETLNDPTAHAEILAIRQASKKLNNWRLTGCEMYVTLEPCPMCAGAIFQSRLRRVVIGTSDITTGSCGSILNIVQNNSFNHYVEINWAYNKECSDIISEFFRNRRHR